MMCRRYELTDHEWSILSPLLPNTPRGVPRVDDRRVLNGILWCFRTGSPCAEIPERYGPFTTCCNCFVRWRKAGVWARLSEALSKSYDGDIVMIDSTCVRVHQHAATGKRGMETMAAWDVPVVASRASSTRLSMPKADCTGADALIDGLGEGDILLADKGYDSNAIRSKAAERMALANIPPKASRKGTFTFSPWVYRQKNLVERFFNRIKQFRGSATRYDKRQENYLAAVKLLAARRWLMKWRWYFWANL